MYLIIGLGVIGFFIGIGIFITDYLRGGNIAGKGDNFVLLFLSVVALLALGFLIALMIPHDFEKEHSKTLYIHNTIQDNQSVSGNFILGSGSINGVMKYSFYCKSGGFIELKQVPYNKAKIKHTKGKPKVNVFKYVSSDSWVNYFSLPDFRPPTEYVIYIPKGTIKHNYNLDAK